MTGESSFTTGSTPMLLFYAGSFLAFFSLALGILFPNVTAKFFLSLATTGVIFAAIVLACILALPLAWG